MASGNFVIKCQTGKGSFFINDLTEKSTVLQLKETVSSLIGTKSECVKILCGYPPRRLNPEKDAYSLYDVNIKYGDTIIIETQSLDAENFATGAVCTSTTHALTESENSIWNQGSIMLRHDVPANNSCLFTSVYFILSSGVVDTEKCRELRTIIAKMVTQNQAKYSSVFLGMSNAEYAQWVLNPDHWGGAIELQILSEFYKIELVAIDTISLVAHRFGESFCFENRAFLIFDGIHYDPLVLELENNKQTIFPSSDSVPMDMAMEIAKEAKESRQFTDFSSFSLTCVSCNTILHGEEEARNHAANTGHTGFDEV